MPSSLDSKGSMIELKSAETTSSSETRPATATAAPLKESLWKEIRQEKKLVWYLLSLMSGVLLYGYDFVIVGTVSSLLAFQHEYGEVYNGHLIIPSNWLAGWKAASPLGCMLGSVAGGFLANKFGRRVTIGSGTFISSIGVAVTIISAKPDEIMIRRVLFLVAKFVQGIGIGQIIVAVQTYVSEVTPPRLRGPVMALLPLATLTGQLIGAAVIASQAGNFTKWAIVIPLASQLAFMIPPAITAFILPESPVHLLEKKRTAGAEKALKRLSRGGADISAMAEAIQTSMASSTTQGTYADCFKAAERPRTMIVLLAFMSPQLWGITLLANASYFMQTLGMSETPSLIWLVVGIILGIVANVGSLWALARIGRRPLILGGYFVLFFVWLSMGIVNCFASPKTLWWSTAALMIVIVVAGVSCWPAFVAVGAEVSSLNLRAKSQGIGWAFGSMMTCIFSVILPYIYNVDAGNLRGKTAFVYAGMAAICVVVSWYFVPETKDMSPEMIDSLFRSKSLAAQRAEEPPAQTELEA